MSFEYTTIAMMDRASRESGGSVNTVTSKQLVQTAYACCVLETRIGGRSGSDTNNENADLWSPTSCTHVSLTDLTYSYA